MRFSKGPQIVRMDVILDGQCEIRFATNGQMTCRIYPKNLDTGIHHVFTMWCNTPEDEESAVKLADLPDGTKITITGHAKTKTFKDNDGSEQSYRSFTVTEWKRA